MARKPRLNLAGVPQHVVQRGNNGAPCFYRDEDYQHFLAGLRDAADRNRCRVHAYVLMTNHIHLLVTPMERFGVSHLMQDVGSRYVRYINGRCRRTGTLWDGRYKSSLVDSKAYLLPCMRYIELNPVRAGMNARPGEYRWSSYLANAYGKGGALLSTHPVFDRLGVSPKQRQQAYRDSFRQVLDNEMLNAIRAALNRGWVLGRRSFQEKVRQMAELHLHPGRSGGSDTTAADWMADSYFF